MTPPTKKPASESSPGGFLAASQAPPSRFQASENDPEFWKAYFRYPQHDLAECVMSLRQLRGLTQAELAQRVGTKQPAIARIEAARANVGLETIRSLTIALDAVVHLSMRPAEECMISLLGDAGAIVGEETIVQTFSSYQFTGEMRCLGSGDLIESVVDDAESMANANFALSA